MKKGQMKTTLEDLHYDVLKEIVIRVAESSDGAKDFSKTISVSRNFRQFVDDGDVLRSVRFDDLTISGAWELFQQRGGLICRCAQAGHAQAQFILGKIILVSASQLFTAKDFGDKKAASFSASQDSDGRSLPEGNTQVSSFLENFSTDQTCSDSIGFHFNFVKHFMSQATALDVHEMWLHLSNYMEYFVKCSGFDWQPMMHWYSWLHNAKEALENLVAIMAFRIRHMHGFVSEKTDIQKLKPEEVGTTEEEFALLFKGLTDIGAALEEVFQAHQDSAKKDAERANPVWPLPWSFSGEAMTLERAIGKFRSAQGCVQEDITGLLSELESRLFCQEKSKHRHDKISYKSWLPFLSAYSLYWNQVWRHAP